MWSLATCTTRAPTLGSSVERMPLLVMYGGAKLTKRKYQDGYSTMKVRKEMETTKMMVVTIKKTNGKYGKNGSNKSGAMTTKKAQSTATCMTGVRTNG